MNEKIEKAIKILGKHLWDEKELWKPVLLHSIRVWLDLINNWYWEDIIIAGFLHDIIEDSNVWEKAIKEEFGENVLKLILSNSKNYSLPKWKERDQDMFDRCESFWKDAMVIKWYDIYDNYYYFLQTNETKNLERMKYLLHLFMERIWEKTDETIFRKLKDIEEKEQMINERKLYKQIPAYKHLTQMPSCCWPTCIQMVLFRHGIWVEQEQLAFDLWLVIEENNKPYYMLPFKVVPKWDPTHWLKFYRFEEEQIINVLKWFWFKPTVVYYSNFKDFENLVIESISKNIDIVLNFKREWISQNDHTWWHVALLSSYDSEKKIVTVCDPTKRMPNYREVNIDELKESMSGKRDWRERWVVIIEKIAEAV